MTPPLALSMLILAAGPAGGAPARAHAHAHAPVVRLVWYDPTGASIGAEGAARDEAAALFRRMGVAVAWRRARTGDVKPGDDVWVVVLGAQSRTMAASHVLGSTRLRPPGSRVVPMVWANAPNVLEAVGISPTRSPVGLSAYERWRFAIALGRVVAHEVVHALAPWLGHGSGLMAGRLARRELVGASITVEPEVALALRAALRGEPVLAPAPSSVLAVRHE